jgi:hypothetical protein
MQHTIRFATGLATFALVAACADTPVGPTPTPATIAGPSFTKAVSSSGTTLSATTTAVGFREDRLEYDWTVSKTLRGIMAGPNMVDEPLTGHTTVAPNDPRWLEYQVVASRNEGTRYSATGARGTVCVTNAGSVATQGLAITDVVQTKTGSAQYQDYVSRPVDVLSKPVLAAGETYCYPYEIPFAPQAGAQYRNTARVTITNHSGYVGQPFGPGSNGDGVKADFTIPSTSTSVTRDATATLDEQIIRSCYNVFPAIYCSWGTTGGPTLPASIAQSTTFDFVVDLYNFAACGESYPFTNAVALTESGPRASGEAAQVRRDSTTLQVKTGDGAPKPASPGCTRTVGYWKNHPWPSGFWYMEEVSTLNFFDTGNTWSGILSVEPRGDAYFILAHQYVAARLNQFEHSYVPPEVVNALQSAHDYFSLTPAARALVSRATIIQWANLLDQYNNGKLGVPHCG